jgi:putative sulfotransferase
MSMRYETPTPPLDPCGIIISSGRCGSTLLSDLIAEEPETLSVPESLGPVLSHLVHSSGEHVTGADYWALLSEPLASREEMTRVWTVLSKFERAEARAGTMPRIMHTTLPAVSAEPELLFAVLSGEVPRFPAQPLGAHHRMLLDLLAVHAGKRRWVERSGASSSVAGPLLRAMPDARIVYLSRDIMATALSMSKHASFRFALARFEFQLRYGTDPYRPGALPGSLPEAADLPAKLRELLPDQVTSHALGELSRDIGRYATMCTVMMGTAEQAFADYDPPCLHRIRYEDLVENPVAQLTGLGEFLGFADPARWAAATAGRVRQPASR